LVADIFGVINAMEEAQKMGFTNVWPECDSSLVTGEFTARTRFHGCFVIGGTLV